MLGNVGPSQAPRGIIPTGTPAIGDVIYASSSAAWARLASSDSGKILTAGGAATAPSWAWPNPANMQIASQAIGDLLYANTATTWTRLGISDDGKVLHSGGAGNPPAWEWVNPADMRIASQTIGDILYASSANAWSRLPDVAVGSVLISGGVGAAPSWDNDPTLITSGNGTTVTPGLTVKNATAATVGSQQYGPSLKSIGYGWGTSLGQSYECAAELYPHILQSTTPLCAVALRSTAPASGSVDVGRLNRSSAYFPNAVYALNESFAASYCGFGYDGTNNFFTAGTTTAQLLIQSAYALGSSGDAIRFYAYNGRRTAGNIISWGDMLSDVYSQQGYVRGVDGALCVAPTLRSSGTPQALVVTGAAHTGITTTAEVNAIHFNLAQTYTWAAGTVPNQRFFKIDAPTIAFASASTCALASTMYISGPPIQGTNCTLTQGHPLHVDSGEIRLDSAIAIDAGADQGELGKMPTGFNKVMNEWLVIHTQNGRRVVPCFAPT